MASFGRFGRAGRLPKAVTNKVKSALKAAKNELLDQRKKSQVAPQPYKSAQEIKLEEIKKRLAVLRGKLTKLINKAKTIADKNKLEKMVKEIQHQINTTGGPETIVKKRFELQCETSTGEGRWVPRKDNATHLLLQKTGKLKSAAVKAAMNTYNVRGPTIFDPHKLNSPYGMFHQKGTDRIPSRPFFNSPTRSELKLLDQKAIGLLEKAFKKLGL